MVEFIVENTLLSLMPHHEQQEHPDLEIAWSLYVDESAWTDHKEAGFRVLKRCISVMFVGWCTKMTLL